MFGKDAFGGVTPEKEGFEPSLGTFFSHGSSSNLVSMARFDSYRDILRIVLRNIEARVEDPLVVEYGPGESTIFMKVTSGRSRIIAIEHQENWFRHYLERFGEMELENVELHWRPLQAGYAEAPLEILRERPADLVYVDGRRRGRCLDIAKEILNPDGGIAVLHDAERKFYWFGYRRWPRSHRRWFGTILDRTLVLFSSSFSQEEIDSILAET